MSKLRTYKPIEIYITIIVMVLVPLSIFCQNPALNSTLSMGTGSNNSSENSTVNMSTGTVSTSISLGMLMSGGYSLPISLNYSATGIRVEQDADWVGLGWNLFTGGQISWNVLGIRDDAPAATLPERPEGENYNDNGGYFESMNDPTSLYGAKNVYENKLDYQPDEFYYSTPRHSGMFVIKKGGFISNNNSLTPILIPYQPLKIEKTGGYTVGSPFKITDDNGYKYTFNTHQGVLAFSKSSESNYENIPLNWGSDYETVKFLDKIEDYNNKVLFSFEYTNNSAQSIDETNNESGVYRDGLNVQEFITTNSIYTVKQITKRISKIIYDGGYVTFERNTSRQDIANETSLKCINFYDNNNLLVRKINFEYSYFTDISTTTKKLRLDKIWEENAKGDDLKPYTFEYDDRIPANINDQDHWGFYNGAGNPNLIPANNYTAALYGNANREPNSDFTQAGVLTKIIYPTNLAKTFVYENNDYGRYNNIEVNKQKTQKHQVNVVFDNSTQNSEYEYYGSNAWYSYHLPLDHDQNVKITGTKTLYSTFFIDDNGQLPIYTISPIQYDLFYSNQNTYFTKYIPLRQTSNQYLFLGNYFIPPNTVAGEINMQVEYSTLTGETEKSALAGGLRIKKIITDDGDSDVSNNIIQYYKYKMANSDDLANQDRSSGYLLNMPRYDYVQKADCENCDEDHYIRGTNSQIQNQALVAKDGIVSYEYITEFDCDVDLYPNCTINTGKVVYRFEYYPTLDLLGENYLLPNSSKDLYWRRNLLKETTVFKGDGSAITKKLNSYAFSTVNSLTAIKFKLNEFYINFDKKFIGMKFGSSGASWLNYTYNSEWIKQISETTTNYENGIGLINTKTITYNDTYKRPIEVLTTYPDESQTRQKMKYLEDFTTTPIGANTTDKYVMEKLKQLNVVANPVYTTSEYKAPESGSLFKYTSASINKFALFNINGTEYFLPKQIYSLDIDKPISTLTLPTLVSSNLSFDSKFILKSKTNEYYSSGTTLSPSKIEDENGMKKYILYNSPLHLPVAEISFQTNDFASYTSYEVYNPFYYESTSNTTILSASAQTSPDNAVTGLRFLQIKPDKNVSYQMPPGDYIISFWSNANPSISDDNIDIIKTNQDELDRPNGWQFNEYVVKANGSGVGAGNLNNFYIANGPSAIAIDEFRIYPKNATMNSTCYNALNQLISTCDINNNIVHTEYDNFNRIKVTKDRNRNIIKKYNYSQGDDDSFYNDPISKTFTRPCETGQYPVVGINDVYPIPINIPSGDFNSQFSKSEANFFAEQYMLANGQILADQQISCAACNQQGWKVIAGICRQGVYESTGTWQCCGINLRQMGYRYKFPNNTYSITYYSDECVQTNHFCAQ